ncbi:MAG: hypothetical protein ACLSWI_09865 [Candidatus Gastranaerophilaceae bacterium]
MSPKIALNEGIVGKTLSDVRNAAIRKAKNVLITSPQKSDNIRGGGTIFEPISNALERSPKTDVVVKRPKIQSKSEVRTEQAKAKTLGDAFLSGFEKFRDKFYNDMQEVCQELPGWTFVDKFNRPHSIKGSASTLDKIARRADRYEDFGFNSAVRDYVRGTAFRPDAEKINPKTGQPHYMDFFGAMEKRGYKIAFTEKETKDHKVVFDKFGNPVFEPDIDVRVGENACFSGYEDVQARVIDKKGNLAEVIILPGLNYLNMKNFEHELFFDNFKIYDNQKLPKSEGAKGIIKELKDTFYFLTRQLYKDAKVKDTKGMGEGGVVTFTKDQIKKINGLFSDLKQLYYAKYREDYKITLNYVSEEEALKRFQSSSNYVRIDTAEQRLRRVMDLYKPIKK